MMGKELETAPKPSLFQGVTLKLYVFPGTMVYSVFVKRKDVIKVKFVLRTSHTPVD